MILENCACPSATMGGVSSPRCGKLFRERRDQLGTIFANKLYMTPGQIRFRYEPNAFLVQTAKRLKPGKALDIAMGQGRNAVFLATQGWDVTGYDLADEGRRQDQDGQCLIRHL